MPGFLQSIGQTLFGKPEKNYQQSTLSKQQQPLHQQRVNAGQGQGAGGAFGNAADYYYDILNNDPEAMRAFEAPEQRRFNEQTIPDLAEQFAGMGSGGLSSSGFRNAAVSAGTDLSERLGAIRANLRQQAAQGLSNIGQQGLQPTVENIHRPATQGLLGGLAQGAGQIAGAYAGNKFLPNFTNSVFGGNK